MSDQTNEFIHPTVLRVLRIVAAILLFLTLFFTAKMAFTFCLGLFADGEYIVRLPGQPSPIVQPEDVQPKDKKPLIAPGELAEIARADIAVAGDMMLHMPIVRRNKVADGYNFNDIFLYAAPYISSANYAVANLETTFAGLDGKEYTGAPNFNSPDDYAHSVKTVGFDMLLTGNEHSYDYGTEGLLRTLQVLRDNGLSAIGTVESSQDPRHVITSIGGIQVGMASYTFADLGDDGNVTLNSNTTDSASAGLINTFDYEELSRFYTEIEGAITSMRAGGADATVLFLHWGDEYSTAVSDNQKAIAQKLCDLGVDVIVGSHPHVVQPLDLLTSTTDPAHTTVCMYSTGNFLSNLRADNANMPTGHCEDGVIFRFTLAKYNDGSVRVNAVKLLPTWVLVRGSGDVKDFYILPLDQTVTDWQKAYALSEDQLSEAKNSYNRTMALVTSGLNKVTSYLSDKNSTLDPTLGVG